MTLLSLFAELQINPWSVAAYRQLAEHYKSCNMQNEAEAFQELIRRKLDVDSPHPDQEQQPNHQEVP